MSVSANVQSEREGAQGPELDLLKGIKPTSDSPLWRNSFEFTLKLLGLKSGFISTGAYLPGCSRQVEPHLSAGAAFKR